MLIVETYLAPDSHGGTGLFARKPIKKGTIVWQHDDICDHFFTIDEYHGLHPVFQKAVSHYGYRARIDGVDGVVLSLDNDRYMNHSETPNLIYQFSPPSSDMKTTDSRYYLCAANTDIPEGTELTMDYRGLNFPEVPPHIYDDVATCIDFLLQKK